MHARAIEGPEVGDNTSGPEDRTRRVVVARCKWQAAVDSSSKHGKQGGDRAGGEVIFVGDGGRGFGDCGGVGSRRPTGCGGMLNVASVGAPRKLNETCEMKGVRSDKKSTVG